MQRLVQRCHCAVILNRQVTQGGFRGGLRAFPERYENAGVIDQGIGFAASVLGFLTRVSPTQCLISDPLAIRAHHAQLGHVLRVPLGPSHGMAAEPCREDMADMTFRAAALCAWMALVSDPFPIVQKIKRLFSLGFPPRLRRIPEDAFAKVAGLFAFFFPDMAQKGRSLFCFPPRSSVPS